MSSIQKEIKVFADDGVDIERPLSSKEAKYLKLALRIMRNNVEIFTIFSAFIYFITLNAIMKYVMNGSLNSAFLIKALVSTNVFIIVYFGIIFIINHLNKTVNQEILVTNLKIINMIRNFIRVFTVFIINFVLFLYNMEDFTFISIFIISLHTYLFTMEFTILRALYVIFFNLVIFNPINFIIKSLKVKISSNMEIGLFIKE